MAESLVNRYRDVKADHVYSDVKGQLTNERNPGIFDVEILPEEKIIREFRVYSLREPRPQWFIYLMACLTCGVYLCYLYGCASCRRFTVGNHKSRVAFTSKGRILMWDSNVAGTMTGDNAASTAFTSVTSVSAYHIQRINSLQTYAGRYPLGPCGLFGEHHDARLRIFFGSSYPKASVKGQMAPHMDSHVVFGMHRPDWVRAGFLSGHGIGSEEESESSSAIGAFGLLAVALVSGCYNWATCGLFYNPQPQARQVGGNGNMTLDISTTNDQNWKDGFHEDFAAAWEELAKIQRFILMVKEGPAPLESLQPQDSNFRVREGGSVDEAREEELVKDTVINVHTKKTPLGEVERVVDALPILPRMTWYECLCVPFICCRRKFNTNAAIIATTQRIISASEYGGGVSDYEFFATSYFLSNFRGGFLIEDPQGLGYTMDIATSYGALRIEPMLSRKWPWTEKVDTFIRPRMFTFLKNIETASATEAVIPAPMEGTIPNQDDVDYAKSVVNLWADECVCSALRSKDLYNMDGFWDSAIWRFLGCNDITCVRRLGQLSTCGAKPWRLDQVLVLTTHRVISYQKLSDRCCIGSCSKRPELKIWFPLADVEGLRTIGTMTKRPVGKLTHMLGKVLPCCNSESAAISVQMGVESAFNTIPLNVGQIDDSASGQGRMEGHQEFYHFRAAFAFYHSHEKPSDVITKIDPEIPEKYREAPLPENLKGEKPENPEISDD